MHFREICPKDFYFAQILRNTEAGVTSLIFRLIKNPEALDLISIAQTRKVLDWAGEELLEEKIFTVENWLEISFHLCKQRWDSSVDWLEQQPMSKILTMLQIVEDFAKKQEEGIKKSSRR